MDLNGIKDKVEREKYKDSIDRGDIELHPSDRLRGIAMGKFDQSQQGGKDGMGRVIIERSNAS